MKKRKILLGLAMAAAAVFALSACDDSSTNNGPTTVDTGEGSGTGTGTGTGTSEGQGGQQGGEGQGGQQGGEGQGGQQGGEGQGGQQGGEGQGGQGGQSNVDESKVVSSNPGVVATQGEVNILASAGKSESATITYSKVSGAEDYNIYVDGTKVDETIAYTQELASSVRTDLVGLTKGTHNVEIAAVKDGNESNSVKTKVSLNVAEYDRSGYAHFNNTEGVGAYKDDGTLKDNAIVLYVTDANKNTVTLSYKGKTVSGIGNILNSVGQACGEAGHETECKKVSNGKTYYGKGNTNQGILLDLAQDNIPLVVRFVGCVSNTGLYAPGTFDAKQAGKIEGLTAYDSVDCGGSEGDNGHMARMKSAKNITLEGVGSEATIDGWGFHLICETAYKELAKNFEVRNLAFINTPEDAIGMEGQETESTLTITAAVERCWVHHNTFIAPKISNPAESDKSEGDGSCDFKRGRYFTCSYNYFEDCHKTNLVGSSKTSVQYCLSYHHNIWNNCAARQPLARQANIHFYNNLVIGTTDTVASLRANSYMFSEGNYYMGCSRVVEAKSENGVGTCKSYNNVLVGCFNNYDATVATDREQTVDSSSCKDNATNTSYANFDTNPNLFYYDSANKRSDCYLTSAAQARLDCILTSGSAYRTEAGKCKIGTTDTNVTTTASSETISGAKTLSLSKAKGIVKVFTVTSPVTITIAATSNAGFDTGYLLKMDGTLVLALSASDKTAVLENGTYVIASSVAFSGNSGKNDKETTVTKCVFEEYNSAELDAKLIASYNTAVAAIPATVAFDDASYQAIKAAMDIYATLGELQSQVTNYDTVTTAFATYKNLGKTAVEAAIDAIGTVTSTSGDAVMSARSLYNTLIARCPDVTISNYATLTAAEEAYSSFAVTACINAIDAIGTVSLDSKTAIDYAEGLYTLLDDSQKNEVTNYSTLQTAKATYNSLLAVKTVDDLIEAADTIEKYEAALTAYNALSTDQKSQVNATNLATMNKNYVIALIDSLPATVTRADKATIELARTIYDALSADNKALVTNYATLVAAEAELDSLPSAKTTYTSNFSTGWTITGKSTASMTGSVKSGENITAVSTRTFTDIESISVTIQSEDKGTTKYTVYYSTDGSTWTEYKAFSNENNNKSQTYTETKSVSGDVYIKVVITCTKSSEKSVSCTSISIVDYE